jgi:hypothetical protein
MPMIDEVFTNKFGKADLVVLERYGDPRCLLRFGEARLIRLIVRVSNGQHGAERTAAWLQRGSPGTRALRRRPVGRVRGHRRRDRHRSSAHPPLRAERAAHAAARETAYQRVDPAGIARSLPGVAAIGGPMLVAAWVTRGGSRTAPRSSVSPRSRSGTPTTPASATAGWLMSASSISPEDMFSAPRTMTSSSLPSR